MTIKHYQITVEDNFAQQRIDQILAANFPEYSRNYMQNLLATGAVKLNNVCINKAKFRPKAGEVITVLFPEKAKLEAKSQDSNESKVPLDIVYEDDDIIVINKAGGVVVHPGAGQPDNTLLDELLKRYHYGKDMASLVEEEPVFPALLHRLDKDTTGLIIAAKTHIAYNSLASGLREKQIQRKYKALVWGRPGGSGEIVNYITPSPKDRTRMTTSHHRGKIAKTSYSLLKSYMNGAVSLIECKLDTGRTHQIRVQFSHLGHSIIGDRKYGNNNRKAKNLSQSSHITTLKNFPRQALHAYYLKFRHPISRESMEFTAELPQDFEELLTSLVNFE